MRRLFLSLFSVVLLIFFSGCTTTISKRCTSPEDNSEHHYLMGMKALEEGKLPLAKEKFDRSAYCDEKFSRAQSGLAIVTAEMAKSYEDLKFREVQVERVYGFLKKAKDTADGGADMFDYYLAIMRVNTALKGKGWLDKVEDAFKEARNVNVDEKQLVYYQGKEAADYFMGLAYMEALEFQKARDKFADVLNSKREGKWHGMADKMWKKTDKIVRAMAGITVGDVGKKIAVKDSITRGDLSALLIDELKIDKLFAGRIPVQSQIDALKPEFIPADIMNHPFKQEIVTILKFKVRGLEPKFDETTKAYLFKPNESVSRGEMAFILEDVLIKLTGDEKLATAYFGTEKSPFPDVKNTSPFFNAVMNMTTRGIMEGELSGEFRINAPVDGPEALLAIRMLKQRINIY